VSAVLADHIVRPARGDDHGQARDRDLDQSAELRHEGGGRRPAVDGAHRVRNGGPSAPPPCFASHVEFLKGEVFDICAALALGESLLVCLEMPNEAAQLGAAFAVAEGRLEFTTR